MPSLRGCPELRPWPLPASVPLGAKSDAISASGGGMTRHLQMGAVEEPGGNLKFLFEVISDVGEDVSEIELRVESVELG